MCIFRYGSKTVGPNLANRNRNCTAISWWALQQWHTAHLPCAIPWCSHSHGPATSFHLKDFFHHSSPTLPPLTLSKCHICTTPFPRHNWWQRVPVSLIWDWKRASIKRLSGWKRELITRRRLTKKSPFTRGHDRELLYEKHVFQNSIVISTHQCYIFFENFRQNLLDKNSFVWLSPDGVQWTSMLRFC